MLAFTVSVMLGSCKKDKENDNSRSDNSCQVVKLVDKGYFFDYDKDTFNFSYNSNGSISKVSSPTKSWIFSYEANKMLVSYDNTGYSPYSGLLTYNYNSNNQIINIKNSQSSPDWSEDIEITYDNNRITKIRTDYDNITDIFTYNANGDIEKIVEQWDLSSDVTEYKITYKEEKYNDPMIFELTFPSLVDGPGSYFLKYLLADYLGGKEKRLIDKIVKKFENQGYPSYTTTSSYSYLKDEKGKIIKIINDSSRSDINNPNPVFDLEYNCK